MGSQESAQQLLTVSSASAAELVDHFWKREVTTFSIRLVDMFHDLHREVPNGARKHAPLVVVRIRPASAKGFLCKLFELGFVRGVVKLVSNGVACFEKRLDQRPDISILAKKCIYKQG